jgi:hypothetical protein
MIIEQRFCNVNSMQVTGLAQKLPEILPGSWAKFYEGCNCAVCLSIQPQAMQ